MIGSPQILMRTSPQKLVLLYRESHLSAFSQHTGAVWHRGHHVKGTEYGDMPRKQDPTRIRLFCLDTNNQTLTERSCQNVLIRVGQLSVKYQPIQLSLSKNAEQVSNLGKCTSLENVGPKCNVGRTLLDRLSNTFFLHPRRRSWDFCKPLHCFINRAKFSSFQNHTFYTQHSVRFLSGCAPWVQFRHSSQSLHFSPQKIRTIHQAAPRLVEAWRDCLSLENEKRCRQSLAPNWKFYESEKVGKGGGQNQEKNRGRWASILVSLCSVKGEPVFLFTLRSWKLKGRHKGDVSFAGGKSDPSDSDVVATALREAREELGITVAAERVWGVLKPLNALGMKVAPVLANLGPLEELTLQPNPEEVEEIFTLSLTHLCNPENRGYTHFRNGDKYGFTLPVFHNGKHRVWGLTAVAVDNTLKLIIPS